MSNGVLARKRRRRGKGRAGGGNRHKENKERKLLKYIQFERSYEEQLAVKVNKSAAMRKKWSDVQSDFGLVTSPTQSTSNHRAKSEIAGRNSPDSTNTKLSSNLKHRYPLIHKRTPSPTQSYLSKIIDDISPNDAADADDPGAIPPCTTYTVDSTVEHSKGSTIKENKDYSICCEPNSILHPKTIK